MDIKQKRILLVDDEPVITRTLHCFLRSAGYSCVESVNDPLLVKQKVADYRPDVMLLDISMPEMDGLDVLEQLGDLVISDSLTVIMVTASEGESVKRKALILGASDFISKPVRLDELAERVASALQGRPNKQFILNSLPPRVTPGSAPATTEER